MPMFEATIWTSVWGERPVPKQYLGPRRFISARSSQEAVQEAKSRWPHAMQINVKLAEEERLRTILIHLNVQVPEDDQRSVEEIASAVEAAIEVGSDDELLRNIGITMPLYEEVDV